MVAEGQHLYVAPAKRGDPLEVLDISDPAAVRTVSSYELRWPVFDIATTRQRLYLSEEASSDFRVLDASDPSRLTELTTLEISAVETARLTASEDYVYYSSSRGGLFFLDARTPDAAVRALAVNTGGVVSDEKPVVVSDDLVYVETDEGLSIFDLCKTTSSP
ncbi:hypothetical protein FIV42_25330 [Persicimonas caeni]|uniref:DUF5050 domain-containing protein n=1 Tax=Persicimonas caeni TaxID=2292766 RepID=A0A4Y6Q051_PERCE|nr:hypothetical protein [Persicimonas caeni]QDG53944.1 hypothetical protein FIV42_25330 [Persicimonas caeni]QED35165.1 hypothetical protein FRD00_25325 [Persicimonas caeni]